MKHVRFCYQCRSFYVRPTTGVLPSMHSIFSQGDCIEAHSMSSACYLHASPEWKPLQEQQLSLFEVTTS